MKRSESFKKEEIEASRYWFKPSLCDKSRKIAEASGEYTDEGAFKRLHSLSNRKREYILELKKLLEKEQ